MVDQLCDCQLHSCSPAIRCRAMTSQTLVLAPCGIRTVITPWICTAIRLENAGTCRRWRRWRRRRGRSRGGCRLNIDIRSDEIHGIEDPCIDRRPPTCRLSPRCGTIQSPPPICFAHQRAATVSVASRLICRPKDAYIALFSRCATAANRVHLRLLEDLWRGQSGTSGTPPRYPEICLPNLRLDRWQARNTDTFVEIKGPVELQQPDVIRAPSVCWMVNDLHHTSTLATCCAGLVSEARPSCRRMAAMSRRHNPLRRDECTPTTTEMYLPGPSTLSSRASIHDRHIDLRVRKRSLHATSCSAETCSCTLCGDSNAIHTADHHSQAAQAM